MKRFFTLLTLLFGLAMAQDIFAQQITDSGYRTVGYIKSDGTIQDSNYHTVGYVKSDGTVQDSNYRTIGYARGIPLKWAAFYFFFKK